MCQPSNHFRKLKIGNMITQVGTDKLHVKIVQE